MTEYVFLDLRVKSYILKYLTCSDIWKWINSSIFFFFKKRSRFFSKIRLTLRYMRTLSLTVLSIIEYFEIYYYFECIVVLLFIINYSLCIHIRIKYCTRAIGIDVVSLFVLFAWPTTSDLLFLALPCVLGRCVWIINNLASNSTTCISVSPRRFLQKCDRFGVHRHKQLWCLPQWIFVGILD